jgi:hypothetical protein
MSETKDRDINSDDGTTINFVRTFRKKPAFSTKAVKNSSSIFLPHYPKLTISKPG